MAHINLTGTLRDAQNNIIPLASIKMKATATSNDVLQSVTAIVKTDSNGTYDFDLNYGRYEISIKTVDSQSYYVLVEDIVINNETVETDLNSLISNFNQIDLLTPEVLVEMRELEASTTSLESSASESAFSAANSASAAADSESNASTSEANALASEQAAAGSASDAATSESNAEDSATAAGINESNAAQSASAASASENNANVSASEAAVSASAAATSESNASASETNALASEQAAAGSASDAATSESNAADSADYANTKASDAAVSASAAATSESNANTSANEAEGSAQAASDSESAAQASEAAAANSAGLSAQARDAAQAAKSDAEASAINAATSESNAAQSASEAAASAATSMRYMGAHDASTGTFPDTTSLTEGALYKISVTGDINGETYRNGDQIIFNGTDWDHVDNTESVTSVAGKVGDVTVSKSDVGLGNVRNVSSYSQSESDSRLSEKLDSNANAVSASKLNTARTITLGGDLSGSTSFDGSGNVTITASVQDDSHNHVISNIDGLQGALNSKLDSNAKAVDSDQLDGIEASQFLRSDISDTFAGKITGESLTLGGSDIQSSGLPLQVNGGQRTGDIYLHEGGINPTAISKILSNDSGVLTWDGDTIWTAGDFDPDTKSDISHSHTGLEEYTRNAAPYDDGAGSPRSFHNSGLTHSFVQNTNGWPIPYGKVTNIPSWTSSEDGGALQIISPYSASYTSNGNPIFRTGKYSNQGWSDWKTILDKDWSDNLYLGINDKANNSDKLDGLHASSFALSNHDHSGEYLEAGGGTLLTSTT
ncbi:prophage tail fiber N-terminal domain-containing protein, partial [Pseudoalteromonas sp. GABNS16G]|uniref:prophage tail fiber N-terminal domain-containing protein n=1 Tax=Pseudoalteromonas sp. GABNS16G TaxID=3025324 RepID=UPI0023589553